MPDSLELIGEREVEQHLEAVHGRAMDARPAFLELIPAVLAAEREIFDGWQGKYVKSGALRDSLTEPEGKDTIRRANRRSLVFGTALHYAVFQRDKGKSAVLRITESERALAGRRLLRFLTGTHL